MYVANSTKRSPNARPCNETIVQPSYSVFPIAPQKETPLTYYNGLYQQRGEIGGMQAPYYSDECAPGKAMDEHLSDSTWAP